MTRRYQEASLFCYLGDKYKYRTTAEWAADSIKIITTAFIRLPGSLKDIVEHSRFNK